MTRYEQGFMNKCAEYGVDGEALLKLAKRFDSVVQPPSGMLGTSTASSKPAPSARPLIAKRPSFWERLKNNYLDSPDYTSTVYRKGKGFYTPTNRELFENQKAQTEKFRSFFKNLFRPKQYRDYVARSQKRMKTTQEAGLNPKDFID